MRSSPWSLAALLGVFGAMLVYFAYDTGSHHVEKTTYAVAGVLVLGGILVALRAKFAHSVALGAGLLTIAVALASYVVHKELVPQPMITIVIGAIVTARVALSMQLERRAELDAERKAMREKREQAREQPPVDDEPHPPG